MPRIECPSESKPIKFIKGGPVQCNPDREQLIPSDTCGTDPGVRCFDSVRNPIDLVISEKSRVIVYNISAGESVLVQNKYRTPNGTMLFSPVSQNGNPVNLSDSITDIILEKGQYRFTLNGLGDSVCLRVEGV
jgi:hypothetical protein